MSQWTEEAKEAVRQQLQEDRRVTVRQVAAQAQMSKTTAHKLLWDDLHMRKLAPKYVPKVLTQQQKEF